MNNPTYNPKETAKMIKKSLKRKTGLNWSVYHHARSEGDYMTIMSLPNRRVNLDYYGEEQPLKKDEKGSHLSLEDQKILSKAMYMEVGERGLLFSVYQRGYVTAQAESDKELTRINEATGWGFNRVYWEWHVDSPFDIEFDTEPFEIIKDDTAIEIEEIPTINPLVTLAKGFMKTYENDLGKVFEVLKNTIGSTEAMNIIKQAL